MIEREDTEKSRETVDEGRRDAMRVALRGLAGTAIVTATAVVASGGAAMACEQRRCGGTPVIK